LAAERSPTVLALLTTLVNDAHTERMMMSLDRQCRHPRSGDDVIGYSHACQSSEAVSLGLINLEQNQIIKIFSIAAVCLMPPTLIASSYGMNFRHMPELEWLFGYPYALALMLIAAIIPFAWFKRKGWL
jgi:magnesium transporter